MKPKKKPQQRESKEERQRMKLLLFALAVKLHGKVEGPRADRVLKPHPRLWPRLWNPE